MAVEDPEIVVDAAESAEIETVLEANAEAVVPTVAEAIVSTAVSEISLANAENPKADTKQSIL